MCGGIFALPGGMFACLAGFCLVWWVFRLVWWGFYFLLFTWPGGLLIELIALHPAWHWRRSALHAIRPSLNTQTAALFLHFHPRWRNFGGFGVEFSADLAKFSSDLGLNFQRIWRIFQRVWAGFHRHWRVWSLRMSSNFHRFCRFFALHTPAFPRFPLLTGGLCIDASFELKRRPYKYSMNFYPLYEGFKNYFLTKLRNHERLKKHSARP